MNDVSKVEAPQPAVFEFGAEAYVSREYAKLEADRLWRKVWQHACRVEELPNVGDFVTYDIMDDTIVIVRSDKDELSAFYNVCAHRGRRLVDGCGHLKRFHCKYHAWQYNLKGENTRVLDKEDWGDALKQERLNLPHVQVDTWGGWVWINMDPEAGPLREYLEPIATNLDPFLFEKMRYRWRVGGVFPCNWKVGLEAFMEAYHVEGTHPQLVRFADFYTFSKADGLHSHKGFDQRDERLKTLESKTYFRAGRGDDPRESIAIMQEEIYRTVNASTTQTMVNAAQRLKDEVPDGASASEITRHWLKSAMEEDAARGVVWPTISPEHLSECGNSSNIFPNMSVAYGFTFALVYRTRPYGDDPNQCYFEGYVIERFPEGEEPKTEWVRADNNARDKWPPVLIQDFDNMEQPQPASGRNDHQLPPQPVKIHGYGRSAQDCLTQRRLRAVGAGAGILPGTAMNIEDERQIEHVLLRYGTAIDRRDWAMFASCFTADVVADYGSIAIWTSRDAITDSMAKGHLKRGITMHRITNMIIEGDAKKATARSYVNALLMPLLPTGTMRRAEGWYDDELVREKNGWKIARRKFVSVFMTDSPMPPA